MPKKPVKNKRRTQRSAKPAPPARRAARPTPQPKRKKRAAAASPIGAPVDGSGDGVDVPELLAETTHAQDPHPDAAEAVTETGDAPGQETESQRDNTPSIGFTIVGVGASAGGLEAFSQLLSALPADANLAIVYVQHLAPRYESSLASLLGEETDLPVTQVTDLTPLRAGHVYVIPPNAFLSVSKGVLRLSPRPEDRSRHTPVDYFFRSLAESVQEHAVGVVLSGTDSDGAAGLREIKAVGGITFAQDPGSAKFDGMPRSAIATGAVDMVMRPGDIAQELTRLVSHPLMRHKKSRAAPPEMIVTPEQWQRVFQLLRNSSGVDFTHYKQPTLHRRLQRRMVLQKTTDVAQYLRHLEQNSQELKNLYQDILIHVTRFFREPDSYEALNTMIFPQIVDHRRESDEPIRVWVPGCSTGEEAYSVAIALLEYLGDNAASTPVQVFATDVSETAVEQARAGIYPETIIADVSQERLRRFFNKSEGRYRISKAVRDVVIFARQDLTRDPPFSKLDLIVCRNVLIYLGPILQKKLMNVFHYALKPTGYLMLGASETIGPHSDLFALADKKFKVYAKKITGARMNMDFPTGDYIQARSGAAVKPPRNARGGSNILNEANRVVLTKYAPPGVIVDEDLQIIQFRGQTGAFLEPAPGEASLNLLKMAREGLLYDLRAALLEARKSGAAVRREKLRVKHNGQLLEVAIEVIPLVVSNDERHFLIVFEDARSRLSPAQERDRQPEVKPSKAKPARKNSRQADERVTRLQQELAASREYLQSIIQDLEAANEELQSANEEILSSNEELQSTNEELDTAKEELQSTNEELNTVNEELQGRNEELSRANSDLLNLLSSVQIAVVMVNSDLRIRRFTPMAEKVLNLIPTDIGRPIGDIKPNLDLPDLENLITNAIDSVNSIEREAKDRQGATYLVRIRPYKNLENRIDGAVVALFDLHHGQREQSSVEIVKMVDRLLQVSREPMIVLDSHANLVGMNRAFADLFQLSSDAAIGRPVYELAGGQWDIPRLHEMLEQTLPSEGRVMDFPMEHEFGSLGKLTLHVNAHRVAVDDGENDRIILSMAVNGAGR
jgi:two-component system CheB/CheR fusion protein